MDSKAGHNRAMRESMSTELARLMKLEGISQSGLSRATGVPQPTINLANSVLIDSLIARL